MNNQQKYCIVGKIASGKSAVGNFLKIKHPTIKRMAFADRIKDLCVELFDMSPDPLLKDRKMLQYMGTACREYDTQCWVRALEKKIKSCTTPIVVDDCRYPNEFKMLRNLGFTMIKLNVKSCIQVKRVNALYGDMAKNHLANLKHESEKGLDNFMDSEYDYVFNNNDKKDLENILRTLEII